MSDLRKAAQQALEALEAYDKRGTAATFWDTITTLRTALAQPEPEPVQEPVAWLIYYENDEREVRFVAGTRGIRQTPLYTAPPQRKPLTEEEIRRIKPVSPDLVDFRSGVRCAERAHGIGGSNE